LNSGIKHWIFQRVSNALIVLFGIFLAATLASDLSFDSLQALLSNSLTQVYLLITLAFACLNSMLAGWQIAGDYAKKFNIPHNGMVGVAVVVSIAYFVMGLSLIFG